MARDEEKSVSMKEETTTDVTAVESLPGSGAFEVYMRKV